MTHTETAATVCGDEQYESSALTCTDCTVCADGEEETVACGGTDGATDRECSSPCNTADKCVAFCISRGFNTVYTTDNTEGTTNNRFRELQRTSGVPSGCTYVTGYYDTNTAHPVWCFYNTETSSSATTYSDWSFTMPDEDICSN